MGVIHLVQVGLMGVVGRYDSINHGVHSRDTQVICRTRRGLEVGTVIACLASQPAGGDAQATDGELLRSTTQSDRLLIRRLHRHRDRAFDACDRLLKRRGTRALLVDVEHLFDGQSVFFYFLGDVGPELDDLTGALAETYEQKVHFQKFSETLINGCGPDCGTTNSGCATGACSSCSLSGGCATRQ